MKPGPRIFHFVTRGGWFRGGARLNQTLVQEGLPTRAPGGSSSTRDVGLLLGAPLVLLLAGGAALVASRRWS